MKLKPLMKLLKPLTKLLKNCYHATTDVVNDIPDTLKMWGYTATAWVMTYIDFESLNGVLKPVVTLIKYGTAMVLLIYMIMKTIEQGLKLYKEWKERK